MTTIGPSLAPASILRPLTPGLAALVEAAARPPAEAASLAALGLLPAPPAGRAVLPDLGLAAPRPRPEAGFAPVRPVARAGTRLLDLTA